MLEIYTYLGRLYDAYRDHVVSGNLTLPLYVSVFAILAGGVILLFKGARLAPLICAVAVAGLGYWGGAALARQFGWQFLAPVLLASSVGLALGAIFTRFWVAALLGTACACLALGVYHNHVLSPLAAQRATDGVSITDIELPVALNAEEPASWRIQPGLWQYWKENVPHLETNLIAVGASACLAGLVVGLLLPTLTRALVAGVLGTVSVLLSSLALLKLLGLDDWAHRMGPHGQTIILAIFLVGFILNLLDVGRRRRRTPPKEEPEGEPEPA